MTPTQTLTPAESDRLAELEPVIEKSFATFVEVGNALVEISDRRLYRGTHSTFKDYCAEKWNMSVQRAYQLCEAAEIVKALPESVYPGRQIKTEKQARALKKVEPSARPKVIESAAASAEAESRPMTARDIETAAKAQSGPSLEAKVEAVKNEFAAAGMPVDAPIKTAWIQIRVEEEMNVGRSRVMAEAKPEQFHAVDQAILNWVKSLKH